MSKGVDILVFTPHPDDAELGAAGSIALWSGQGRRIVYVVCSSGEKGTGDYGMDTEQLRTIREDEQTRAARVLGVETVEFLRLPDQGIEDDLSTLKIIVRKIRQYMPHTVMTTDPYHRYIWHRDHRNTGRLVLDAVYPYARDHLSFPDLLNEGLYPHKVREVYLWGSEEVNCRVDITSTFEKKIEALLCHSSQLQGLGIRDLRQWVLEQARQMAQDSPYELAEGFHHIKIPLHGIV